MIKEAGENDFGLRQGIKVLVPRGKLRLVDEVNGSTFSCDVSSVVAVIEQDEQQ